MNVTENVHRKDSEGCFAQDGGQVVDAGWYFDRVMLAKLLLMMYDMNAIFHKGVLSTFMVTVVNSDLLGHVGQPSASVKSSADVVA